MAALVAVAATLLLAAQSLISAPAAGALPAGAWWYTSLNLPQAWTASKGAGVTVAVIDSGVKASLGDLRGQVLPGLDLTGTNPGAQSDTPESGTPTFGHGTDMAALIAGTGRGAGMVGVAPDAKILPVAVPGVGTDTAQSSPIAQGIRWAVDHGAKVINLSVGGAGACSPDEGQAIAYAYRHDVVVVASAGNTPGPVGDPADCPGAIAVAGVDAAFKPWTNSASGPDVDFVGPAFNLVNEELNDTLYGPYPGNAGTSMATAIVSGTFALLRAKFPHESARQIVARALYHVHNGLGAGHKAQRIDDHLGYGEILPYNALTEDTPADAPNPIYDRFDRELATTGEASNSSGPPVVSDPNGSPSTATAAPGGKAESGSGGSSGLPIAAVIGIVVAIIVAAGIVTLLVVRQRRTKHGSLGPPSPGGSAGP